MNFNKHSELLGQHAFLGASKYYWLNYDEDKLIQSYMNSLAVQKGTEMLQSYPFTVGNTADRMIVLEGNHHAVHGQITKQNIPHQRQNEHRVELPVLVDASLPDPMAQSRALWSANGLQRAVTHGTHSFRLIGPGSDSDSGGISVGIRPPNRIPGGYLYPAII